jgi:dTDP-4-amino-4,6-dideoxygalactose transaminase
MPVPYFRLEVTPEERAAVDAVLLTGWLTTGKQCLSFEREFADAIGSNLEAISVNSNTAGMHLVLEALGIGPGDEVIVPSLTFTATAEVVRYVGADVVLVDVDPKTLCLRAEDVERAITPKTKAVMVVHFGGLAADLKSLSVVTRRHGLKLVEDSAHAFPCTHGGTAIGADYSDASVFSFYANKTLTTGEGGMIVTRNPEVAKRCRTMRLHGIDRDAFNRFTGSSSQWRYDVVAPGFKYNLTDIAAALGREQLKLSSEGQKKRVQIADAYYEGLSDLPIDLPANSGNDVHAWHLFWFRLQPGAGIDREAMEQVLSSAGIGYSMHYTPLHRMTYWRERYGLSASDFPHSENHGLNALSLPIFTAMRPEETAEVIKVVRSAFKAG